jgi:hypothetical protein
MELCGEPDGSRDAFEPFSPDLDLTVETFEELSEICALSSDVIGA